MQKHSSDVVWQKSCLCSHANDQTTQTYMYFTINDQSKKEIKRNKNSMFLHDNIPLFRPVKQACKETITRERSSERSSKTHISSHQVNTFLVSQGKFMSHVLIYNAQAHWYCSGQPLSHSPLRSLFRWHNSTNINLSMSSMLLAGQGISQTMLLIPISVFVSVGTQKYTIYSISTSLCKTVIFPHIPMQQRISQGSLKSSLHIAQSTDKQAFKY